MRIRLLALPFDSVFRDLHVPDLGGGMDVGAAVGLLVDPLDVDHTDRIDVGRDQVRLRADQIGVGERLGARQEQHVHRVRLGERGVESFLDLAPELLADGVELEIHPGGSVVGHVAAGHLRAELGEHDAAEGVQRRMGPHDPSAPVGVDRHANRRADRGRRGSLGQRVDQLAGLAVDEGVDDHQLAGVGGEDAGVPGLATAARIRDGSVEHDARRRHRDDPRIADIEVRIRAVEPLGHGDVRRSSSTNRPL